MTRKKVRTGADLPDWFDITSYDILETENFRNDELLIYQLVFLRVEHLNYLRNSTIPAAPPRWIKDPSKMFDLHYIRYNMKGVSFSEKIIQRMAETNSHEHGNTGDLQRGLSVSTDEFEQADFQLHVDLKDYSNKYILQEIERLLPLWRRHLGIKEPAGAKNAKVERVIKYKAIPYLDLLIWAECEGVELTPKAVEYGLFFNGSYMPKESTLRTFIDDLLSGDFLDKWQPQVKKLLPHHYGGPPKVEIKATSTTPTNKR